MRVFVVVLVLIVAVPVAAVLVSAGRSDPPGGLTRDQAIAAARALVRCGGADGQRRITRCTARDDAWECTARDARGDEQIVTVGGSFATAPLC
ncbi:hypothetical protein [Patulibacter sp.]|uniref:hypothetical protein n=1 Tax=Patulibacter sp. TaxID=1912859 RepID=UPI0027291AE3|nr:hypothetical protein [Patulibacter sp.]MDO9407925.1 hypothetical protein [Patulibacter sp.]